MTVDEYMEDAKKAGATLTKELGKIFDEKYSYFAGVKNIVGPCFVVDIYNVPPKSPQLDYLNAKMSVRFMLHLTNDFGRQVDTEQFSLELIGMSYQIKNKGLKYRKIAGKSPSEVCTKFLAWVKKNEELLKSM